MNWICMTVAALAGLCLYLASPHQTLWRAALRRKALLRWLSAPLLAGAAGGAAQPYGAWSAVCMALAGLMAALVALPYLDAWLHGPGPDRKEARHVG
ncbi:hypothetical protein ACLB1G_15665 [Oxalobacteraceae bacterium A2-2]